MRIYYTPELDWLSHQGFEPENVYLFFNEGLMTCLNQGQIDYLGYSTDKNYHNFLNLASEPLLYVIDKNTKQGELMTKNGEVYNAVPEPFNSQPALTKTSPCNTLLYVRLSEYNGQKDVSVTLKEGKLAVKPLLFSIIYKVTSNSIYGLDRQRRNILKTDSNLDTLWSYELEYKSDYGTAKDALFHNQTLINFIGAREETFERTDRDVFEQYRGGALIALDTDTGQLKWQFECETYLDNYQLDQGRLYYGAHDGVRILDPDTGELLQFIASGLPEPKNHPRFLCSVFVDKSYIYFCYSELGRWYVYDKHSYQQLTILQLPEHCVPWRHIFTDNNSGKHYFYLSDFTKYVDRSYLFELDRLMARQTIVT